MFGFCIFFVVISIILLVYKIKLDDLEEFVCEEMNELGNLLGQLFVLIKMIREINEQKVLRNLIYVMMEYVDFSGLKKDVVFGNLSDFLRVFLFLR